MVATKPQNASDPFGAAVAEPPVLRPNFGSSPSLGGSARGEGSSRVDAIWGDSRLGGQGFDLAGRIENYDTSYWETFWERRQEMQGYRQNSTTTCSPSSMELGSGSWKFLRSMPRNFTQPSLSRSTTGTNSGFASQIGSLAATSARRMPREQSMPLATEDEIRRYVANIQRLDTAPHISAADMFKYSLARESLPKANGDLEASVLAAILRSVTQEDERQQGTSCSPNPTTPVQTNRLSSPRGVQHASPVAVPVDSVRSAQAGATRCREAFEEEAARARLSKPWAEQLQQRLDMGPASPALPRAIDGDTASQPLRSGETAMRRQQDAAMLVGREAVPMMPASALRKPIRKSQAGRLPAKSLDATDASPKSSVSTNASTSGSPVGASPTSSPSVASFHLNSPTGTRALSPRWLRC